LIHVKRGSLETEGWPPGSRMEVPTKLTRVCAPTKLAPSPALRLTRMTTERLALSKTHSKLAGGRVQGNESDGTWSLLYSSLFNCGDVHHPKDETRPSDGYWHRHILSVDPKAIGWRLLNPAIRSSRRSEQARMPAHGPSSSAAAICRRRVCRQPFDDGTGAEPFTFLYLHPVLRLPHGSAGSSPGRSTVRC